MMRLPCWRPARCPGLARESVLGGGLFARPGANRGYQDKHGDQHRIKLIGQGMENQVLKRRIAYAQATTPLRGETKPDKRHEIDHERNSGNKRQPARASDMTKPFDEQSKHDEAENRQSGQSQNRHRKQSVLDDENSEPNHQERLTANVSL